jgi:hypothetical protein
VIPAVRSFASASCSTLGRYDCLAGVTTVGCDRSRHDRRSSSGSPSPRTPQDGSGDGVGRISATISMPSTRRVRERMPIIGLGTRKVGGATRGATGVRHSGPRSRSAFADLRRAWPAAGGPAAFAVSICGAPDPYRSTVDDQKEVVHYLLPWPRSAQRSNGERPIPRPRPPPRRTS